MNHSSSKFLLAMNPQTQPVFKNGFMKATKKGKYFICQKKLNHRKEKLKKQNNKIFSI